MADSLGLQEIDAGANACSVEWCPIAGLESYVACSTYLLEDPERGAAGDGGVDGDAAVKEEGQEEEAHVKEVNAGVGQTRSGSIVVHKVGAAAGHVYTCRRPCVQTALPCGFDVVSGGRIGYNMLSAGLARDGGRNNKGAASIKGADCHVDFKMGSSIVGPKLSTLSFERHASTALRGYSRVLHKQQI